MKRTLATSTAILMAMGLAASSAAQDVQGKAQVGDVKGKAEINLPDNDHQRIGVREGDADAKLDIKTDTAKHGKVGKAHKASGILGMEVKNQKGETLGEIQDLVIDWSNGRVSYAVLSTGGFLGVREKYIAVPPSAFKLDHSDNKLVLNVDKAKVDQAPGFAKTNWPEVDNPAWGAAADWGRDPLNGDTELKVRTDLDRGVNVRGDANIGRDADRDSGIKARGEVKGDRDYRSSELRSRPGAVEHAGDFDTFKGRVTAVNIENRTVTVEGESGSETFHLADKPTLKVQSNRNPSLVDFKVGYNVIVEYHQENGEMMAHKIIQTSPVEIK